LQRGIHKLLVSNFIFNQKLEKIEIENRNFELRIEFIFILEGTWQAEDLSILEQYFDHKVCERCYSSHLL